MNSDDLLTFRIVMAVCSLLAVLFLTVASCACVQNHQDNDAFVKIVAQGADPISARCAIREDIGQCSLCSIAATHATQLPNKP